MANDPSKLLDHTSEASAKSAAEPPLSPSRFPRLTSSEPFIDAALKRGYAMSDYMTQAQRRMATGVRVTFKRGKFTILSNPHGLGEISWGAYEDGDQARTMYLLCCSLADLPPSSHLGISGIAGSP